MTTWLLGTLLALILTVKALDYFGLFGLLDFLTVALRLVAVSMFGMACLVAWVAKRMFAKANSRA